MIEMLSEEIANGLISYEMKHNIKKEIDEEVKYGKSLMKDSYNNFLLPIVSEMIGAFLNLLNADR